MKRTGTGVLLTVFLLGSFIFAFDVRPASGQAETFYINSDGSVVPSSASISSPDNITYTFTDNINGSIVVNRDNIVLDGDGHTLQGTGVWGSNGIELNETTNVTLRNTRVTAFQSGVFINCSSNNTVFGNNITNNAVGFFLLAKSSDNRIYHNNIVDNSQQVAYDESAYSDFWDDGYPTGGNYWGDYAGADLYSGPYQNENGSDGIGDTPRFIDANNRDNYPVMELQRAVPDITIGNVTLYKTVVGGGYTTFIEAVVQNQGDYLGVSEVTLYANTTVLSQLQVTLPGRNALIVTFAWNTTGFEIGRYSISAYAEPALAETNTSNNNCTGGYVSVAVVGDLTGPLGVPDGKCDKRDLDLVAAYFGQGVPPAPSNCDITGPTPGVPDDKIDIRDISTAAKHFGEHYP